MSRNDYMDISKKVNAALNNAKPIVALESTIISHGLPYPENKILAFKLEQTIHNAGAVAATIGIVNGRIKVGMDKSEIELFANNINNKDTTLEVIKTSRRDMANIVSLGKNGATTVAATMMIAKMAGIRIFATGGIGGVHQQYGTVENNMDISADLLEFAKSQVAVICAGAKSILDIAKTLEVLETNGVPILGYQCDAFPAFHSRDNGHKVDINIDRVEDIAKILKTRETLGIEGGELIANPIPKEFAMPIDDINIYIKAALKMADSDKIAGKEITPYLLSKIAILSGGKTITANEALIINNAKLAAKIAIAYEKLK